MGQAVTGESQQAEGRVRALSCMNCRPAGIAISHLRIRVVSILGNKELSVRAFYRLQRCRQARGNLSEQRARREKRTSPRHIFEDIACHERCQHKVVATMEVTPRTHQRSLHKTETQSREAMILLRTIHGEMMLSP